MNRLEFNDLVDATHRHVLLLNGTKGADYSGDEDVLWNFRHAAERLGLTSELIWAVYAGKHWDAIMAYCCRGKVESEPVAGRITDLILYLHLLRAMVWERGSAES